MSDDMASGSQRLGGGPVAGGNEEQDAPLTNPTASPCPGREAAKDGTGKVETKLQAEIRGLLIKEIADGVQKGLGYVEIWKSLREEHRLDISRSTVRNWLYRLSPEVRKERGQSIPRELRIKVYGMVRTLRDKGLTYDEIIDTIYRTHGVRLRKSVVSGWCRGICTPFGGTSVPAIEYLEPTPELAYVIGVVCGDGTVRKSRKRIKLEAKDIEFIEEFARCIAHVLRREPPRPKPTARGKHYVSVESKVLSGLLQKPIDINKIRKFIEYRDDCKRSFLKGFFDSEGHVSKDGGIDCTNTDLRLLMYVQKLLDDLGVETTGPHLCRRKGTLFFSKITGKTHVLRKDIHRLYVRRYCNLTYYRRVGFNIRRKKQRVVEYLRRRGLLKDTNLSIPPPLLSSYHYHFES